MLEAPAKSLTVVRVAPPDVGPHGVTFRWDVAPSTALYRETAFRLDFPESIDCQKLPPKLWWTVAMLCLHPQWLFLRPCRVELPVRLSPGEKEWWLRLLDAGVATLESLRGSGDVARSIELVDGAEALPEFSRLPETGRCVAAFSGGKDSLVQTALLCEFGRPPVLVTTTSPMEPFFDHETERRREVFREISRRRNLELVEVKSNLRSVWLNDFGWREKQYPIAASELSDTFLYFSNALVVGVALGATHVFLASEAEVQENALVDERVVQHSHFMYSGVTQRAVSALLEPLGVTYSSLTSPLHQDSVQKLLWTRYRDLADLQYSCWNVPLNGTACNACVDCLKNAMCALAAGGNPARMGIELADLLPRLSTWDAAASQAKREKPAGGMIQAQIAANIAATPVGRVFGALVDGDAWRVASLRTWRALVSFARLRRAALRTGATAPGWRPGFLRYVDPLVRDGLALLYTDAFPPEDEREYEAVAKRADALVSWIAEPLEAAGRPQPSTAELPVVMPETDDAGEAAFFPDPEPALADHPEGILRVSEPLLDGNELRYVSECITSNWISSSGPFVSAFERGFAEIAGCRYGIACSSGTAALHLVLATLGLHEGDEVVIPAFTMIATANAVAYTGADFTLVDAEPATWNLDVRALERSITPRTKAIIVVHTYGSPADMDAIDSIARKHGITVIEDAAESHGASYHDRPVGSLGGAATFSFYANKIITTGEGGMVTTSDARFATVVRRLRDHGFSDDRHFVHRYRGFNYRMTNLQAAVGLAQVERFEMLVERRRSVARWYAERLQGVNGLTLPRESPGTRNVFWMYAMLVDEQRFGCSRDELRRRLASRGIETRTTFVPIHRQPIYRSRFLDRSFPVAEMLSSRGFYVPSSPALKEADVERVVSAMLNS